jgi:hypothetical protein
VREGWDKVAAAIAAKDSRWSPRVGSHRTPAPRVPNHRFLRDRTGDPCVEQRERRCADMCVRTPGRERRSVRAFGAPTSSADRQLCVQRPVCLLPEDGVGDGCGARLRSLSAELYWPDIARNVTSVCVDFGQPDACSHRTSQLVEIPKFVSHVTLEKKGLVSAWNVWMNVPPRGTTLLPNSGPLTVNVSWIPGRTFAPLIKMRSPAWKRPDWVRLLYTPSWLGSFIPTQPGEGGRAVVGGAVVGVVGLGGGEPPASRSRTLSTTGVAHATATIAPAPPNSSRRDRFPPGAMASPALSRNLRSANEYMAQRRIRISASSPAARLGDTVQVGVPEHPRPDRRPSVIPPWRAVPAARTRYNCAHRLPVLARVAHPGSSQPRPTRRVRQGVRASRLSSADRQVFAQTQFRRRRRRRTCERALHLL